MPALLLTVRFHDGRYHGLPDWPPSPARLFQALVAGAARGASIEPADAEALEWLERLGAPGIAAPRERKGVGYTNFVPNNDLDAVGGDPKRVDKIRAGKTIRPMLFDVGLPLLYAWRFAEGDDLLAKCICAIAERLYQLGRGVDMAWATGAIISDVTADECLADYDGKVYRPSGCGEGETLAVPQHGSLASLIERHKKSAERFTIVTSRVKVTEKNQSGVKYEGQLFSQPPKPHFRQVAYDCPSAFLLFDLEGANSPWPLDKAVALTEHIRDCAAARLADALPDKADCVQKVFIGRGSTEADKLRRIRIVPLPSVGHPQADRAIRRALIEIPPNCPLPSADIEWAFSGLTPHADEETGEILLELIPAASRKMLEHYGVENDKPARLWRSVTPAALPESARRRRIDPKRMREEAKGGNERVEEEARAARAVAAALRHVGVRAPAEAVRVQREPFAAKGVRAESFEPQSESLKKRFPKERLWHVEVAFAEPVAGPLVIGDGRWLGLGLMAPEKTRPRYALCFDLTAGTRPPVELRGTVVRAVRRALMSRARDSQTGKVPTLFSGHDDGPEPARGDGHRHVFLFADDADGDGRLDRVFVIAPWRADRSGAMQENRREFETARRLFEDVASELSAVRAGAAGLLRLAPPRAPAANDSLFAAARIWTSVTPYRLTRHPKGKTDVEAFAVEDLRRECARRDLPRPDVEVVSVSEGPRGGLAAMAWLRFASVVRGPILLGRGAHLGLGAFRANN